MCDYFIRRRSAGSFSYLCINCSFSFRYILMSDIKSWTDKFGRSWALYTGKFKAEELLEQIKKAIYENSKNTK